MLNEFPVIYTNIWDAVWAIPATLLVVFVIRIFFKVHPAWLATIATVTGLIISIFISHPNSLSAGIFMGFFYGGAAMGVMYSVKQSFMAFRNS